LSWNIQVPANSKAVVYLPAYNTGQVTEGGKTLSGSQVIQVLENQTDQVVLEIGSGVYSFLIKSPTIK
jgi:alpha-L-rhamnosidase